MARKIAVVLFNLGGPDGQESVKPFLRNLFRDPAIIGAPGPIREFLAWFISTTRTPEASENYAKMGGGSPIVPETEKQMAAMTAALKARLPADDEVRLFMAMRYWHPFVEEAVNAVKAYAPDEIVLLPLYPQFSTTTTASSLKAWKDAGGPPARTVCCYPMEADFVQAHADLIRKSWTAAGQPENARILYSAHGLPEVTVKRGDPYQWQVEQTVAAVAKRLPDLPDFEICYQSRVGPLKWIGPPTDEAILRACEDGKHIFLTPIAFVSEHIETLVELDEEYREVADENGAPGYDRVPALGDHPAFIDALAKLTIGALEGDKGLKPPMGERLCPKSFGKCPCLAAKAEKAA